MIRFAWTRFRTQAAVAAGVLAVAAVILLVTGIQLAHAYDAAVAACKQQGNCANLDNFFPSTGYLDANGFLGAFDLAVPALIGMFWGAPLIAREFETGTFRLAWTQGVTRTRWLAAKIGIAGLAAIAAAELFSLMVGWWASPINKSRPSGTGLIGSFHSGIAPVGYVAFGLAFGVAAGLFIRRTLPAMAVTLAVVGAVIVVFPIWVRPHLIPPDQTTMPLSTASINGFGRGVADGPLFVQAAPPDLPGAWVLSSQLTTPAGLPASSEPNTQACASNTSTAKKCVAYIESLHLRQTVTYQPASRYWDFQWIETGIYLALALLLAGLCFLRVRPGRPAAPDIPRPSRLAPALERSP